MFGVILGFDIKDYSHSENIADMEAQRKMFSDIISDATKDIRVFKRKEIVDTGDGCFLLIDTGDYRSILLAMEQIQEKAEEAKNIFFRGVAHLGRYEKTEKIIDGNTPNFIGKGINKASRYLEANCLKELLANNDKHFVFGITTEFYEHILDTENFDYENYKRYGFKVKKFSSLIYLNLKNIENKPEQEKIIKNIDFKISDVFDTFLKKSDFIYEKNNDDCNLDTFYVFPELRIDRPEKTEPAKILSDDLLKNFIKSPFNIIIAGDDQSGKTSLCKQYFINLFASGDFVPVYFKTTPDERGDIFNKIQSSLLSQYDKKIDGSFDNNLKILLIDDFQFLNEAQQIKYIKFISEQKNYFAIIFVDQLFMRSMDKKILTKNFKEYTIREFGHLKRNQLIEKWITYINADNKNYKKTDELSEYINNTFLKGIMPFTPFYILTVLAANEDFVPLNGELTSKGHCYQALIYISLRKMNVVENEIGAFLNILANIAFRFFKEDISSYSEDDLFVFLNDYSKKYNMPFENEYFMEKIEKSHVFYRDSINQFSFYAPYLYHYFVAKYISEKISDEDVKGYIEKIYSNLDNQSNAYIGIFIIHHSKNIILIKEILSKIILLYSEYPEISLNKNEIKHIDEYAGTINREVIEAYDKSEEERKKRLLMEDADDDEIENYDGKEEINKEIQRIKKAIRTVEVMGHILKNHSGEIEIVHLKECFLSALNVHRRICNMFIIEFKNNESGFVDFVANRILDNDNSLTRDEISKLAHNYFIFYNVAAIYAAIVRSVNALGSKGLSKIIREIAYEMDNPIGYCVYFQCEMWYNKGLLIEEAKKVYKEFPDTVKFIMRKLIKEYIDLHHIDYRNKQEIADKFGMEVKKLTYDYEK
jgi:GTPase SAR1 family protein